MMWIDGEYFVDPVALRKREKYMVMMTKQVALGVALTELMNIMTSPLFKPKGGALVIPPRLDAPVSIDL